MMFPTPARQWALVVCLAFSFGVGACVIGACGAATKPANTADAANQDDDDDDDEDFVEAPIRVRPRDKAPPPLGDEDKRMLGGRCAAIEPVLYDAHKQALFALDVGLTKGDANDAAEKAALDAAMAYAKDRREGMAADAHERCLALFQKHERRRLFDHEPAIDEARITIDSCVRRAAAAFGSDRMVFATGDAAGVTQQGPFCPDDDPVPMSLNDLPYKSNKDDWDTPTWRCLKFGLRTLQRFQLAYIADPESNRFDCVARIMPRHGGTPLELSRGGKMDKKGELTVSRKLVSRKMKLEQ
jgi:hypothetical protein